MLQAVKQNQIVAKQKKWSHKGRAVGGMQRPFAKRKLLITGLVQAESSQVRHIQTAHLSMWKQLRSSTWKTGTKDIQKH